MFSWYYVCMWFLVGSVIVSAEALLYSKDIKSNKELSDTINDLRVLVGDKAYPMIMAAVILIVIFLWPVLVSKLFMKTFGFGNKDKDK